MGAKHDEQADSSAAFATIVAQLAGLTTYDTGGIDLIDSYLAELTEALGEERCRELVEHCAALVAAATAPAQVLSGPALAVRRLVPGADVTPLSTAAEEVLPVTERAVALGTDLSTVVAAVVAVTGLSTHSVRRTRIAERVLLDLRAEYGSQRAAELCAELRREFDAVQEQVVAARLNGEFRRAATAHVAPATPELASGAVHAAIDDAWREIVAFQRCRELLTAPRLGRQTLSVHATHPTSGAPTGHSAPAGTVGLIDDALRPVRDAPGGADRIAAFTAGFEHACAASALPAFTAALAVDHPTIERAIGKVIGDADTFLAISTVLTGMTRIELVGTGQTDPYLDQVIRAVGADLTDRLLSRAQAIIQDGIDDPAQLDLDVRLHLLADQELGPIARAVTKMWFLGQWDGPPGSWYSTYVPDQPAPAGIVVVSADAYQAGLAWGLAGAHPQGARQPGYGSWALPPGTDAVV